MHARCIQPAPGPVNAELSAPPSKSWTHRALVAAALADGVSRIGRPLDASDTRDTRRGIVSLGVTVEDAVDAWIVHGRGGAIDGGARLDCGASGTSARFLAALSALGSPASRIDGSPRLRTRPMEELVVALRALGARVESEGGHLPMSIDGPMRGGVVTIPGERSSQFASALLLVAASLSDGLELTIAPPRASMAYVVLTERVLESFGVAVSRPREGVFVVTAQSRKPAALVSEGDHSSASYALLAAAVTGGRVRVSGLDPRSVQPDARFSHDLERVGCAVSRDEASVTVDGTGRLRAFDVDLEGAPDLAPATAVLALFCDGTSRLRRLGNLRLKESDRLEALASGLTRLGATVHVEGDAMTVRPPAAGPKGATIDVMDDHRIAMAFAVAGLRIPGVAVSDARVVEKSYPGFWEDFERLSGR
jgi:3-phosphoshikimate 1-carboxyvinyltransferase